MVRRRFGSRAIRGDNLGLGAAQVQHYAVVRDPPGQPAERCEDLPDRHGQDDQVRGLERARLLKLSHIEPPRVDRTVASGPVGIATHQGQEGRSLRRRAANDAPMRPRPTTTARKGSSALRGILIDGMKLFNQDSPLEPAHISDPRNHCPLGPQPCSGEGRRGRGSGAGTSSRFAAHQIATDPSRLPLPRNRPVES